MAQINKSHSSSCHLNCYSLRVAFIHSQNITSIFLCDGKKKTHLGVLKHISTQDHHEREDRRRSSSCLTLIQVWCLMSIWLSIHILHSDVYKRSKYDKSWLDMIPDEKNFPSQFIWVENEWHEKKYYKRRHTQKGLIALKFIDWNCLVCIDKKEFFLHKSSSLSVIVVHETSCC